MNKTEFGEFSFFITGGLSYILAGTNLYNFGVEIGIPNIYKSLRERFALNKHTNKEKLGLIKVGDSNRSMYVSSMLSFLI